MKTTIRIQNFKSLEDVTLELAPTTVFLGPNGAGKSSVLKMMELVGNSLKQFSSYHQDSEAALKDSNLPLADYKQLAYKNESNRKITFELNHKSKIGVDNKGLFFLGKRVDNDSDIGKFLTEIDKFWKIDSELGKLLDEIDISIFSEHMKSSLYKLYNNHYVLNLDQSMFAFIAKYITVLDFSFKVRFQNSNNNVLIEFIELYDNESKASLFMRFPNSFSKKIIHGFHSNNQVINDFFKEICEDEFLWNSISTNDKLEKALIAKAIKYFKGRIESSKNFSLEGSLIETIVQLVKFSTYFPSVLGEYIITDHVRSIREVPNEQDLLRRFKEQKYPPFEYITIVEEPNKDATKESDDNTDKPNSLTDNEFEVFINNSPVKMKVESEETKVISGPLGIPDKDILEKILRIEEIERILKINEAGLPDRLSMDKFNELTAELKVLSSSFQEHFLLDERNFIKITSKWLAKLDLGRKVWFDTESKTPKLMVESSSGAIYSYTESSSGMIQLFPIIMNQFYPEFSFGPSITSYSLVEQPELHLHPRLQSEIAELCSNNSPSSYDGAKYIIETHSEHLIRGYQLLIAEGKIKPQHIRFYYFNPVDNKTKVIRLKVDKYGNFTTPWPNGFFGEAYDLTLKLLKIQLERRK